MGRPAVARLKPRIICNSIIPRILGVDGITIYPFIFLRCSLEQAWATDIIGHELVHADQVRAHGWFVFYAKYAFQFARNFYATWGWDKAYRAIPFEQEAYRMQHLRTKVARKNPDEFIANHGW